MEFQSYSFGKIVFDNQEWKCDIYVSTSGEIKERSDYCYQKFGTSHVISKHELEQELDPETEILIIGLGESSVAKIEPDAEEWLKEKGIELIAQDTGDAIKTYNETKGKKSALMHLTC